MDGISASSRAKIKYNKKTYAHFNLTLRKEIMQEIRDGMDSLNVKSKNAFILEAIREKIEREKSK